MIRRKTLSSHDQILRNFFYHATAPLRCGNDYFPKENLQRACTPQYALVYISTGAAEYSGGDGQVIPVEPGQCFQRFPECEHEVRYFPGTRTHFVAIPSQIFDLMQETELPTLRTPVLTPGKNCGFASRQKKLTRQLRQEQPQTIIRSLTDMQQLIVDMHILCLPQVSEHTDLIAEVCDILGSNFESEIRVDDLAVKFCVSYSLLRKEFKEVTGLSPGNYRLQRRLERAQELLLLGESITAVAARLGYSNIYAFSAQFKKHRGVSPSMFAQRYREV